MLPGHPADLRASRIAAGNVQLAPEQTQLKEHRDARSWVPPLEASGNCYLPNRKCMLLNPF